MAEFKPVMIDNAEGLDTTVGAMNVNKETGDITFVTSNGNITNKGAFEIDTSSLTEIDWNGLVARVAALEAKVGA